MLYISSDHAGFKRKKQIGLYLRENAIYFKDLGPTEFLIDDDYSDYVANLIDVFDIEKDQAILICGSGQGMSIAANRHKGVRAALAWSVETAISSRNDDDCNILCLGGIVENIDPIQDIVEAFLKTPFEAVERRIRRIKELEENN